MASLIVWTVLAVAGAGLGVTGACFSLRTVRVVTGVTAVAAVIAVTRYGLAHPGGAPGDLAGAFLRGADAVTAALPRPLAVTGPGATGPGDRWIAAVVLLVGYRQLEAWTRRWQAPELDLSALGRPAGAREETPDAEGARRHAELAAALRFRLPAMEIRAPSILPGGSRTSALASIAESSGMSGAGLASALIRLASLCWPGPRRIRVRMWTEPPLPGAGTRVSVLLEDARTGQTIATKTVAGEDTQVAASMAAGYIARQFFAMDRTVPTWCYGAADGRDLGAMQLARMERVHVACRDDVLASRREQIRILGRARGNRSAGVARYELARGQRRGRRAGAAAGRVTGPVPATAGRRGQGPARGAGPAEGGAGNAGRPAAPGRAAGVAAALAATAPAAVPGRRARRRAAHRRPAPAGRAGDRRARCGRDTPARRRAPPGRAGRPRYRGSCGGRSRSRRSSRATSGTSPRC